MGNWVLTPFARNQTVRLPSPAVTADTDWHCTAVHILAALRRNLQDRYVCVLGADSCLNQGEKVGEYQIHHAWFPDTSQKGQVGKQTATSGLGLGEGEGAQKRHKRVNLKHIVLRDEPFSIFSCLHSQRTCFFVFRKQSQQLCRVEEKLPLASPLHLPIFKRGKKKLVFFFLKRYLFIQRVSASIGR